MPRNVDRNDRPALLRAGKLVAEGFVRTEQKPRSQALEKAAEVFGYPNWNRMVGDAERLDFPLIGPDHPPHKAGNIIAAGTGDAGLKALVAAVIRAGEISPDLAPVVLRPITMEGFKFTFRAVREAPKYGVLMIMRAPGMHQDIPGEMGNIWAGASRGHIDNFSFSVDARDEGVEIVEPRFIVHACVLNSIPGKRLLLANEARPQRYVEECAKEGGEKLPGFWKNKDGWLFMRMGPAGPGKNVRLSDAFPNYNPYDPVG